MKRFVCAILLALSAMMASAQEVEFTADRPGASTGPATVAQGVIQLEQGIQYDGDGAYVYCGVDGRAKKVFIETGIFDEECIEVISGLSLGDIVVTSWSPKLTDGVLLTDVTE